MGREPDNPLAGASAPGARQTWTAGYGLARGRRLRSPHYREAFDQDRSFPGRYLVLFLRNSPDADRRLGVVTSRRTLPSAVARNRARRLLREAFRLGRCHLRPDVDVLLLARGRIERVKRQDVDADLRAVCRKAGIWKEQPC